LVTRTTSIHVPLSMNKKRHFTVTGKIDSPTANGTSVSAQGLTLPIWLESRGQSTTDLVCNPAYVNNFRQSSRVQNIHSNGGTLTVDHRAKLLGYCKRSDKVDFKKHLSLQVGQYCQVHENEEAHNSMKQRTRGAIVLGSSGNLQGGFIFMALDTGKKITRYAWETLPISQLQILSLSE